MITLSHNSIATFIHEYINNNLGFTLSLSDLKLGSIKPDFIPTLVRIPHYKAESFNFLSEMTAALQNRELPVNYNGLKHYSSELGVILHFITDYFCYPHNNKSMDKMPRHFLYELKLEAELRKALVSPHKHDTVNVRRDYFRSLKISLKDYLEEMHGNYLKETPGPENDLRYILRTCCVASMNIITSSMIISCPETA